MTAAKHAQDIAALRDLALADLESTTDQELRTEALEEGLDLEANAIQIKSAMRDAAARALRQRMATAKTAMQSAATKNAGFIRPGIDRIKALVQQAFQTDSALGLAFRDGKRQSDGDWETLYDDLVSLGKIAPEQDAN
jgi:hypothetical protein